MAERQAARWAVRKMSTAGTELVRPSATGVGVTSGNWPTMPTFGSLGRSTTTRSLPKLTFSTSSSRTTVDCRSPIFNAETDLTKQSHEQGPTPPPRRPEANQTSAGLRVPARQNCAMTASWPVVNIDEWTVAGIEKQGRHPHDWLRHGPPPKRTWLFKPARPERERSGGEDVAEKLGCEIARLIGVPAAPVELAIRGGIRGALVEDVRPPNWELQAGRTLMPEAVPDYDPDDPEQRGYSVAAMRKALRRFAPPPQSDLPPEFDAFDAITGYLLFDALIAHGDRHDRNWAVLVPPPGSTASEALCASFDHAASLGFLLTEEARVKRVDQGTVADWAHSGRARRFEHQRGVPRQTLVDLAASAAGLCSPGTGSHWRERILSVDADSIKGLVESAPGLSTHTHRFITELVMINRGRLLDVIR